MIAAKGTEALSTLKGTGYFLNYVAKGVTGVQIATGQYNGRLGEASADLAMGFVAFIPGWGWAASGAYFLIIKPVIKGGGK